MSPTGPGCDFQTGYRDAAPPPLGGRWPSMEPQTETPQSGQPTLGRCQSPECHTFPEARRSARWPRTDACGAPRPAGCGTDFRQESVTFRVPDTPDEAHPPRTEPSPLTVSSARHLMPRAMSGARKRRWRLHDRAPRRVVSQTGVRCHKQVSGDMMLHFVMLHFVMLHFGAGRFCRRR